MTDFELRPAAARGRLATDWLDARLSFSFGGWRRPDRMGFGALRVLNEDVIAPASGFAMHPHEDVEILLMPLAGAVAHEDSLGHRATVQAGEVLHMSAGRGIRHSQMNASASQPDRHLQVWLHPRRRGTPPAVQWRALAADARVHHWQRIASPDGADGSLPVDADAIVMRARLDRDDPLAYTPAPGRSAYLHVIDGAVSLDGTRLGPGDAAAWAAARPFVLRREGTPAAEVLLFDLATGN